MSRHFNSISSILLGVSILCLNFSFTHAAVETEPSTTEVTTQSMTQEQCLADGSYCCLGKGYCFCCGGQYFRYRSSSNTYVCEQCAAGTHRSTIYHQFSICSDCFRGMFSAAGAIFCTFCQAGKYNAQTAQSVCADCTAGTFSASAASTCTSCQAGKYNSQTGKSVCAQCPAGTYNLQTGQTVCENCAAGKYLGTTGATQSPACGDCQIGKFSATGASVCSEWSYVGLLSPNGVRKPKTTTIRQLTIICPDFSCK